MQGQFGIPGSTTALTSYENQFIWGGDVTKVQVIMANVIVSGAARDAGATPTTVLRSGLIMGRISATGLLIECDPTATDGSQVPVGILNVELLAVDPLTQVATNRAATIVALCPVKVANDLENVPRCPVDVLPRVNEAHLALALLTSPVEMFPVGLRNRLLRLCSASGNLSDSHSVSLEFSEPPQRLHALAAAG